MPVTIPDILLKTNNSTFTLCYEVGTIYDSSLQRMKPKPREIKEFEQRLTVNAGTSTATQVDGTQTQAEQYNERFI